MTQVKCKYCGWTGTRDELKCDLDGWPSCPRCNYEHTMEEVAEPVPAKHTPQYRAMVMSFANDEAFDTFRQAMEDITNGKGITLSVLNCLPSVANAAPDLLEACEYFIEKYDSIKSDAYQDPSHVVKIRAAIAKAGRTNAKPTPAKPDLMSELLDFVRGIRDDAERALSGDLEMSDENWQATKEAAEKLLTEAGK